MIKKLLTAILCVVLMLTACLSVSAVSDQDTHRVYDEADLLTSEEIITLEDKLNKASEKYGCEVIVATAGALYKDPMYHAEDKLNEHFDLTNNSKKSGICLLVSMSGRKYGIHFLGDADEKVFKETDRDDLEEIIKPYLSDGEVYNAFCAFADKCEETIEYYYTVKFKPLWILISLGVGIVIAFIVVLIMKSQLKSVRFQAAANNYLKNGSLNITESRDIFLYSTVVRTEIPKANTSSSPGSSGGSGRSGSF